MCTASRNSPEKCRRHVDALWQLPDSDSIGIELVERQLDKITYEKPTPEQHNRCSG
jgi:hypothetical protein